MWFIVPKIVTWLIKELLLEKASELVRKVKLKNLYVKVSNFSSISADWFSKFVGSWTFVFIYTFIMFAWVGLHQLGILSIDSDFAKWSLWIGYFSGIQASIVLMSSERQASIDRKKADQAFKLDKQTLQVATTSNDKIVKLVHQIEELEDIIDTLIEEKANGHEKKKD
jgi:uncharacterized membrane protein